MNIDWQRKRWLPIALVLGVLVLVLTVSNKRIPKTKVEVDNRPLVSTHLVSKQRLRPQVIGYGKVRPKETWDAVAEVTGRVIFRHPELEKGKSLAAGVVLLKIDPLDYQLKLAQARSELASSRAELDKITLNESKLVNSLKIEKRRLAILNKELERKQNLNKTGAVSSSVLEQEKQNVLAQEQKVLDLDTNLKLVPNNLEVANASIQVAESRVREAERKLEKTIVTMPFDGKISDVSIERDQVVTEREVMVKAHRWDRMEIATQVSLSDMRALISHIERAPVQPGELPDIARLNIEADVVLYAGEDKMHWQAKVTRVGDSIDPQGNSVVLMVEVEQGLRFDPMAKPPLINEMYVEVIVSGPENEFVAIPTQALHGSEVYVLDTSNSLMKKSVDVSLSMGDWIVVDSGLTVGDKVIVNDLIPAVTGMSLREVEASLPTEQVEQ